VYAENLANDFKAAMKSQHFDLLPISILHKDTDVRGQCYKVRESGICTHSAMFIIAFYRANERIYWADNAQKGNDSYLPDDNTL